MDKLRIQKVIRFFEYLSKKEDVDFSNFKLGGVSYELEENRENLLEYELIAQTNTLFSLTSEGKLAVEELRNTITTNEYNWLVFAKQQLNDLTDDELLFFMYMTIPETQKFSTEFQRLEKKKESLVKSLFSKRRIDLETATKWLRISEADFLKLYPKKQLQPNLIKALIEGYQKAAKEDLEIAKSFEKIEDEVDVTCDA